MAAVDRSCVVSRNPLLQQAKFARQVGRSALTIARALQPCAGSTWFGWSKTLSDGRCGSGCLKIYSIFFNFLAVMHIGVQNFEMSTRKKGHLERHWNNFPMLLIMFRMLLVDFGSFQDPILQNGCWSVGSWVWKARGFYMPEIQICGKPKIKYQIGINWWCFLSEIWLLTYLYSIMILTFQWRKEGEPIPFRVIVVGRYMTCPKQHKFSKESSLLVLHWRIEWKYCDLDTGDCYADRFNTWGSQKCRWYRLGLGMSRTSTGNHVRNVCFDLL